MFDRVSIARKAGVEVARDFADYAVTVDEAGIPDAVKLIRRLG